MHLYHVVMLPPQVREDSEGKTKLFAQLARLLRNLLEMLTNLLQPRGMWSAHWPPLSRLPRWENLASRINIRKTNHMSILRQLTLMDYAGNKSLLSLSQEPLVGHEVWPVTAKDFPNRPFTKGIKSPSQIPGQSQSLSSVEQDWKHQGPEDSDFRPSAQVPTALHPMNQGIHDSPGLTQMSLLAVSQRSTDVWVGPVESWIHWIMGCGAASTCAWGWKSKSSGPWYFLCCSVDLRLGLWPGFWDGDLIPFVPSLFGESLSIAVQTLCPTSSCWERLKWDLLPA